MEAWADNFLWVAVLIAGISVFVPGRLKLSKLHWFVRAILRLPFTFVVMTLVGAAVALLLHLSEHNVLAAVSKDPIGGVSYFSEVGWETGVFWLPVALMTTIVLAFREARRR